MSFYGFFSVGLLMTLLAGNLATGAKGDNSLLIRNPHLKSEANNKKQSGLDDLPEVTFSCLLPALCKIEKKEIPAHILEDETFKPDGVHSRHLSFKFGGDYGERSQDSFFEPEISVYPVSEFRQSFAVSSAMTKGFDEDLNELRRLITKKTLTPKDELPFLPYIDAHQEFISHLKYLSFKNGKGMFFLTQYNIEPSIITNGGLTYIFQGITDDGKYYVLAAFPVRTRILPNDRQADKFGNYRLPTYFYEAKNRQRNETNYKNYVLRVKRILAKLDSNQFNPNLKFFEELITTLEVK